jgi:hypothetical protein
VLIVDELARLTPSMQGVLMANLSDAVRDGLLDQVLLLLPSDEPRDFPGWETINVGGAK